MNLYILTSSELPLFCPDDHNLINTFKSNEINPIITIWNKEKVPASATVLIRTIWDYTAHENQFRELLEDFKKRNIKLINPIETVLWNMDKTYLKELYDQGHSVVPTFIFHEFKKENLDTLKISYPIVVKPLVGASGINTFKLDENDSTDISALFNTSVIAQPFIESVITTGEISFIFFNNKFSHCLLKSPKKGEFRVQDDHGGSVHEYNPSDNELNQIQSLVEAVKHPWTYARVDVVKQNNQLLLMELEMIEPELFFRFSKDGEELLAKALKDCATC